MSRQNRRVFVRSAAIWTGATLLSPAAWSWDQGGAWQIASFQVDVSPPAGHPLCGGWIEPVVAIDDALEAIGYVLLGNDRPIVVCAIDWTGLLNATHRRWRIRLAEAAGTTLDRVALQVVHQHNAPFVCEDAQSRCAKIDDLRGAVVDPKYLDETLTRVCDALSQAIKQPRSVTHVATSQATVERVASNRRFVGPDGKISDWRGSSSRNRVHQELPEGLIDPQLRTVAFYDRDEPIVACHYYATHPMSYYGDGRVTSDFVGLARKRMQQHVPDCRQIYFTGCAGNVAAGKYNDGTPQARAALTDRVYQAMATSMDGLRPEPLQRVGWQTRELLLEPRSSELASEWTRVMSDTTQSRAVRVRAAMRLSWLDRCTQQVPITLSALHLDRTSVLHLPAEAFVEYQLRAQQLAPQRFVATAAYGDGGPWYIPTRDAYPQGGYEVDVAFSEPSTDDRLMQAIDQLVRAE